MIKQVFSYLFLGVALTLSQALLGQSVGTLDEDVLLHQLSAQELQVFQQTATSQENQTILRQSGNNNSVNVDQVIQGADPNLATIIQDGQNNSVDLDQDGSGNNNRMVQRGNNNEYSGTITGNDHQSLIEQTGNNNSIQQDLLGSELNYILIQRGNNHEIIQEENSMQTNNPAYQITQTGNGMTIFIRNSKVY